MWPLERPIRVIRGVRIVRVRIVRVQRGRDAEQAKGRGADEDPRPLAKFVTTASAGCDDVQLDRGLHLGVQSHASLERADRLDRAGELDLATVELGTT